MAQVWYVGVANVRTAFGQEWSFRNGWSLPMDLFSQEQLQALAADPGFELDQQGLRPKPPAGIQETPVYRESEYYIQILAMYTEWKGAAGTVVPYHHVQSSPAATWTVNHALNRYPAGVNIMVGNESVEADVTHPSANQTIVTFPSAVAGRLELI